jgi:hypothetical protein
MPSKTLKQHNLMEMVAHNPKKAKELGIPQKVGKDFEAADKGKKFGTGGGVGVTRGGKGMVNRQATRYGSIYGDEKNVPNINLNKYVGKKEGGLMKHDDIQEDKKLIKKAFKMHDEQEHGGKHTNLSKLNKGGSVKASKMGSVKTSAARDGVAVKGHTKGRVV